ncbi:class I SAM-dependent methyltransferase [Kutzneria sp. CA-103260]|uniref:class I SAM-dependent methyltransferase n=1 Tax=Kutzneria sp. CA-103260 TaxID=2802641 RepID=UPI001BADC3E3|nr:class I SAM-dependent methyltransferase [Kutzneria sp. CA-103260]QUQ69397.1 Trans-aconitate 2-methyltransferase [Kutzneria sp. CA-103260]
MDRHVWQADHYRRANTRQLRTAIEALELADLHGGRLADIGCGTGETTRAMAERGFTVIASDVSPSMVEATRDLCQGLPVTVDIQDARELKLDGTFDIVHCSWVLHWLDDIDHALAEMARAVAPGGALVLQWSRGKKIRDGQDVVEEVMARPRWRDRLADTPFAMRQHPAEEVVARLVAAGLTIELPPVELDAQFGTEPVALGRIMRAAGLAAQADRLGDDADDFVTEVATATIAANAMNPHNTRLIARAGASRAA